MTPETQRLVAQLRRRGRLSIPPEIARMIGTGALFAVSHSGGKDSQAMLIVLGAMGVPAHQLLVVHADLGAADWPGTLAHIRETIGDVRLITAVARRSFFEMVEHRGRFPSPTIRQCTSDLKRGPIERELRRYLKRHPEFDGQIVNCMGMRAAESAQRAKRPAMSISARNSRAGRTWVDWLPIQGLTTDEVFRVIAAAGQIPHRAYGLGMTRLSCCFCIMASRSDLTIAARANPALYARYVALERRLGHRLSMGGAPLDEITGIPVPTTAGRPTQPNDKEQTP